MVVSIGISAAMQARHRTRRSTPAPVKLATPAVERPSISRFVTTVPRPNGELDVLVTLRGDGQPLALFDARTRNLHWQSGTFGSINDGQIVVDAERAYVAEQSRVSALRLSDGHVAWESSLATEANSGSSCHHDCFRVLKDRVIALQRDGTLQAFDAASGRQVWSRKIPGTPSRLFLVGDLLAVNRAMGTRDNTTTLDLLAPEDGQLVRTLQPWCTDKVFHKRQYPDLGSRQLFSADGRTAYFFFGIFSKCVQAMRVDTGEKVWNSYVPGYGGGTHLVLGERRIVFEIGRGEVMSIDTATGKATRLFQDQESESVPLYVLGDQVILRTAPTWDRNRVSLVAVNGSGARSWQFLLSARDASTALDMFPDDDSSTIWIRPTRRGLLVAQQPAGKEVSLDVLDVNTGVSSGRKILAAGNFRSFIHLSDDLIWMQPASEVKAFSASDGTLVHHLP